MKVKARTSTCHPDLGSWRRSINRLAVTTQSKPQAPPIDDQLGRHAGLPGPDVRWVMQSVAGFLGADHDRLDALLADAADGGGSAEDRRADAIREFISGLRRHIAWEEEILFPAFEARTGMADAGPTAVMRMEHERIEQLLAALEIRADAGDLDGLIADLVAILGAHNGKEEMILYPWIDRELAPAEVQAIVGRMTDSA